MNFFYFGLVTIMLFMPLSLSAEGFVLDKNEWWITTEYLKYETDHYWNKNGDKHASHNDFKQHGVSAKIEYGLTADDTLITWAGYAVNDETLNGKTRGFEDFELGWRRLLIDNGPSMLCAQLSAIIPGGEEKATLRYGRFGCEPQLLYSRMFEIMDRCAWIDTGIGYRFYTGFPSDQARGHFTLGCNICSRLLIMARSDLIYGVFNGREEPSQAFILLNPNFRLLREQFYAVLRIYKGACLTAGYFWHVWGENVGTGDGFNAGVSLDF